MLPGEIKPKSNQPLHLIQLKKKQINEIAYLIQKNKAF
jgi:hypothetical protein